MLILPVASLQVPMCEKTSSIAVEALVPAVNPSAAQPPAPSVEQRGPVEEGPVRAGPSKHLDL